MQSPGVVDVHVARERILRTAYDLFARRGTRGVGIDEVIGRAGVAKATFYRHFPSKDDLVLAFLQRREEVWAHPAGQASIEYLDNIRTIVAGMATEAGLRDPAEFARSWHILMKGSIIAAAEGDTEAAQRAKAMGRLLIEQHR